MRTDHPDPPERDDSEADDHLVATLLRRYARTSIAENAPATPDLVATATHRSPQCGRRLLALIAVLDAIRTDR
jgi:hypothetical protein